MKNIIKASYLFLVFILTYQSVKGQDNVTTEGGKQGILGTLMFNKSTNKLYVKPSGCEQNKLFEFKVDQSNYNLDISKTTAFLLGKKMKERILNFELTRLKNLESRTALISKNNLNTIEDKIKFYFKDDKMVYVDKNYYSNKINSTDFTETMDGLFKIEFSDNFKILYKPIASSEPIEIISLSKDKVNESNFYSFSYDMQDSKLASVSVKNDDKFLVYIYNAEKKSLYPEVSVTNSFNFITTKLNLFNTTGSTTMAQIAKDMIPRLYTIDEKNNSILVEYVQEKKKKKGFFSDLDLGSALKEGVSQGTGGRYQPTESKVEEKIEEGAHPTKEYESMSKDIWTYIEDGGLNSYNDTLQELTATKGFLFSGSMSEDGNSLLINTMPTDPSGKLKEFATAKMDYTSLIALCPNKPDVIAELALLNQQFIAIEKKANLEEAKFKRFSIITEEVKDASGLAMTNVRVLKDCKNLDLENTSERDALKELVNNNYKNLGIAIANIALLSGQYIIINSRIDGCKLDIDTKGAEGLGAIANGIAKGGLKVTLVSTMTKATKVLDSYKNSQSELDNAKKVLESYKKTN